MSTMPIGWALATVGDVADLTDGPFGSNLKTAHYTSSGPRVIRLQNIGYGTFRDERAHITQEHFERLTKHSVHPSDVVAASLGEDAPRACLVPPWLGPAIVKADCIRVRTLDAIEPAFLMWMLNSPPVRAQAAKSIKGVGRPRLGLGGMRRLAIPVPPSNEQRRIVAAIDEQFSRLEQAEGLLRKAQSRLGSFRTSLLAESLRGWPEHRLGDLARVYVGTTPSRRRPELWQGDVPWVSSGEVAFGRIRDTREKIAAAAVTSPDRLHPPGTVLLAMIGEGKTRGQAAILDIAATHNQNSAAVRLDQSVCLSDWLFYVLMARYEETRQAGSGAQQPALNNECLSYCASW